MCECVGDGLHEPAGGAGGAGDADGLHARQVDTRQFLLVCNHEGVGLHALAVFVEVVAVGAALAANEDDGVDAPREGFELCGAVGHAVADGVVGDEIV